MNTITLSLSAEQQTLLQQLHADDITDSPSSAYMIAQYRPHGCVISLYQSGKAVFQGKEAEYYASIFLEKPETGTHAGSDEVGTGDYYGPVCVCATVVKQEDTDWLIDLKVGDSKGITDERIKEIAPQLRKRLAHSLLILDNNKYNLVQQDNNMNRMKARMHNQAYLNLQKKCPLPALRVIDQFTPERSYYNYLKEDTSVITGILFRTKAENQFLAVACASIIARYAFLQSLSLMEEKYDWKFPKGAGHQVDENARQFVQRFGMKELGNVAKLNFKNTQRVQEEKP